MLWKPMRFSRYAMVGDSPNGSMAQPVSGCTPAREQVPHSVHVEKNGERNEACKMPRSDYDHCVSHTWSSGTPFP